MAMKIYTPLLLITFLTGCAVYNTPYQHASYGTFDPARSNNYSGKIAYEPGGDYMSHMRNQCASYGGLDLNSVRDTTTKTLGNHFGLLKEYKCKGFHEAQINKIVVPLNAQNDEVKKLQAEVSRLQELEKAKQEPIQPEVIIKNVSPESERFSLEVSKKKCAELGFKPATEGYGKCVLQLSK
jgi:hypothetical protein